MPGDINSPISTNSKVRARFREMGEHERERERVIEKQKEIIIRKSNRESE